MHRLPDLDDDDFKVRPPWGPMIVFTCLSALGMALAFYLSVCVVHDGGCRINWGTWTEVAGWRRSQ